MSLAGRWTDGIARQRHVIALLLVAIVGISAWAGPRLMGAAVDRTPPPASTVAAQEGAAVARIWPSMVHRCNLVVVMQAPSVGANASDIRTKDAAGMFERALNRSVHQYRDPHVDGLVLSVQGYWLLADMPSLVRERFVSADHAMAVTVVEIRAPLMGETSEDFAAFLTAQAAELAPPPATAGFTTAVTGVPAFVKPVMKAVERDMATMDGIVVPVAFVILGAMLRSARLMVVPLLTIPVCLLVSFSIMYGVANYVAVFTTVPSLMMSLCLATSIDYNLFSLVRYRLELERMAHSGKPAQIRGSKSATLVSASAGNDNHGGYSTRSSYVSLQPGGAPFVGRDAVERMLATAGHTIVVSGSTLALCFLGMLMIPMEAIQTLGVGCSVTIMVTVTVNVTVTPLLLVFFDGFFAKSVDACCVHATPGVPVGVGGVDDGPGSRATHDDGNEDVASLGRALLGPVEDPEDLPPPPSASSGTSAGRAAVDARASRSRGRPSGVYNGGAGRKPGTPLSPEDVRVRRSMWYRLGTWLVKFPVNLIVPIVVVLATIPFDLHATHMSLADSVRLDMPRELPQTKAYESLLDAFGHGFSDPYSIIMVPPPGTLGRQGFGPVMNDTFFEAVQAGIATWATTLPQTSKDQFNGIMYAQGSTFSVDEVVQCLTPGSAIYPLSLCAAARFVVPQTTKADGTATLVTFSPRFDAVGPTGKQWLVQMRSNLAAFAAVTGIEVHMISAGAGAQDIMALVYSHMPRMVAVTCVTVLVFVGCAFRSIVVPLRSVLTIALTVAFVYGASVMTYEDGMFDWTHIVSLMGIGVMNWMPPVCTLSIVCGILLDYDVFLTVAVMEARRQGHATKEAIVLGLSRTGYIITAAGVIMAVAFSGLLFSSIETLNLFGFLLCFACLFDTFVVRVLICPSLMSLAGEFNWWPVPQFSLPRQQ